jgi:hypothetical protein
LQVSGNCVSRLCKIHTHREDLHLTTKAILETFGAQVQSDVANFLVKANGLLNTLRFHPLASPFACDIFLLPDVHQTTKFL